MLERKNIFLFAKKIKIGDKKLKFEEFRKFQLLKVYYD